MDKIIEEHLHRMQEIFNQNLSELLNEISNKNRCGATPKNSLQKPKKGLATPELDWPPPSHAQEWSLLEPRKVLAALRISNKKEESCQNAIKIQSKNCPSKHQIGSVWECGCLMAKKLSFKNSEKGIATPELSTKQEEGSLKNEKYLHYKIVAKILPFKQQIECKTNHYVSIQKKSELSKLGAATLKLLIFRIYPEFRDCQVNGSRDLRSHNRQTLGWPPPSHAPRC